MTMQGLIEKEAIKVKNVLDAGLKAHQKGGVCYDATKALLCVYRGIKYDKLVTKVQETEAAFEEYEYCCGKVGKPTLEELVTISDQRLLCRTKLQTFIDAGDPAAAYALVLLVDLSMQILSKEEPLYVNVLNAAFITKKRKGSEPEDAASQLGLARTTYYRERDRAIAALSQILFGYLGHRYPDSILPF